MNRLWVRLSLAFSIVVLLSVVILILSSLLISRSGVRESFILEYFQSPDGVVERLVDYYEEHESWEGVDEVLSNNTEFVIGPRFGVSIFLMDSRGLIVFATPDELVGQVRNVATLLAAAPILVQGERQGYIGIEEPPFALPPGQARFVLEQLSTGLLTLALIVGVIGVLSGVLMSRSLTAPLSRLTEAARAIGARNLSRRVKAEGTTEVAELAHAFNDMASALEQNEKLRRNLVADVAHELRTPLSVLQGNLLAILDDVYPMEKPEVARLYDQTRLLGRLVDDLHELSQAEANQIPLNLQPVQVGDLIGTTVATFRSLAEEAHVMLGVEVPSHLPLLLADSARLSQVLHNLLNNALVHTPEGGRITIRASHGSNLLKLSVQDTGDGISPEHLPYIFERFYRADRARSRHTGGTGLGLAIVKAIVEAHGGRITVISDGKPGQGSMFTIEFPQAGMTTEVAVPVMKQSSSEGA